MNLSLNQLQGTERNLNSSQYEQEPLFGMREFTKFSNLSADEVLSGSFIADKPKTPKSNSNHFRDIWNFVGIVLAIYSAVVIPFFVAFVPNRPFIYTIVDLAIDAYFTIDLILLVWKLKMKKIIEPNRLSDKLKLYFDSTLVVDLLSTFPIDKVLNLFHPVGYWPIIMLEMLKVLRIHRISLMVHNRIGVVIKLIQIVLCFIIILHVTGCIWYIIVRIDEEWLPYQDVEKYNTDLYSTDIWNKYFICIYEGVWLIFGQEIAPRSMLEIWTASFFISLGIFITSYIFGEILMIISSFGLKYKMRKKSLDFVLKVTNEIQLPKELKSKILAYIMNVYSTLSSQIEFDQFFKYISPTLQNKVLKHIYRPILTSNDLLELDTNLSEFLLNRVRYHYYLPEEEIVVEGTRAHDFFILAKGACAVFVKTREGKKSNLGFLNQGKHFGEIGLLYKTYRTATIISHGYSTVAQLTKQEFRTLTNVFPYVADKLKEMILNYNDPWKNFIANSLTQSKVFDSLPSNEVEELVYKMKIIKLQPGEFLFKADEPIIGVYLLATGSLHLSTGLVDKSSKDFLFKSKEVFTEFQECDNFFTLTLNKSKKIKAEVIPVVSEEYEVEESTVETNSLEVGTLISGTLIYPRTGLKTGIFNKLNCKALDPCTIYWIDSLMIRNLAKENEDFKKFTESQDPPDYFEFLNPDNLNLNLKFLFRKSVVRIILANREANKAKNHKFKEMLNMLRAVVACQNAGNNQLAELVMKDKVNHKFITPDGSMDLAYLYKGSLPSSNPVLKKFNSILSQTQKGSVMKQCGSLKKEINMLTPKIKNTKERITNSINLLQTLIDQIK